MSAIETDMRIYPRFYEGEGVDNPEPQQVQTLLQRRVVRRRYRGHDNSTEPA
jgi:hypothetical protein